LRLASACSKPLLIIVDQNEDEDEDEDKDGDDSTVAGRKRKKIRKIINKKGLSQKTVDAAKAEEERRERIAERQKLVSCMYI
jgi:hypothetical protein